MFEETMSLLSIWASMNTWLTPTVLFLLLNLMIGTIAVTSGFTSHHHPDPSFHHPQPSQQPPQPHLTRSPSVLQRLKSINFYSFYSHPPTTHFHQPPHPPPQQPESEPTPQPEPESQPPASSSSSSDDDDNNNDESPTLDEIYSRIKQEKSNPNYGRQNSDTKPSGGEVLVKLPKKMMKSASDKSAFNHFHFEEERQNALPPSAVETVMEDVEVEEEKENAAAVTLPVVVKEEREDEGVDAKADDFINRFRKQLQMQRNDSIVRSYKEMISRTSVN